MAEKHSLWLMPEGAEFARLAALINRLAATYSTPVFPPHITLAGGIRMPFDDIMETAGRIAADIEPFTLMPGSIGYEDEYYRCLYLRIAETDALMRAHETVVNAFGLKPSRPFTPHLSLLYCDIPINQKDEIVRALRHETFPAFDAVYLYVYITEGAVGKWSCEGKFHLGRVGL